MTQIIPSILIKTKQDFINQIHAIENSVTMAQFDIADGEFVPNTTWSDPEIVGKESKIDIELHLMVSDPLEEIKKWTKIKPVKRVLVHYESTEDLDIVIEEIKNNNWQAGIVLNPSTAIKNVKPYLNKIKSVMFMGVVPGFQGQKFIPETLDRIRELKQLKPEIFVEVDGGVNLETIPDIVRAGADAICPGSAVFGNELTPAENIDKIQKIIKIHD